MTRADTLRKIRQLLNVFHYTKREVDQINEIIEREIQAHTHNFVTEDEFNNILIQYGLIRSPETIGNIILTTDKSILSHVNNESAIFSATVYDENGDVVTGETVTFYINDEVYDTATTDATGVATVSYSSQGAGDLYIKAKFNNIESTNITVQDIYYYDAASEENVQNFLSHDLYYNGMCYSSNTITYNETERAYELKGSGSYTSGRYLELLNDLDNISVTLDFKFSEDHPYCQIGHRLVNNDTPNATDPTTINILEHKMRSNNDENSYIYPNGNFTNDYFSLEGIKQGNILTGKLYDPNGILLAVQTIDLSGYIADNWKWLFEIWTEGGTGYITYIKNIRIKTIENNQYSDIANDDSKISNYGDFWIMTGSNPNPTLSFNSEEEAYQISGTGDWYFGIPITPLNNKQIKKIEIDFKNTNDNWRNMVGIAIHNKTTNTTYHTYSQGNSVVRGIEEVQDGTVISENEYNVDKSYNQWYKLIVVIEDNTMTAIYKNGNTTLKTLSGEISMDWDNSEIGFMSSCETGETTSIVYIKNISCLY